MKILYVLDRYPVNMESYVQTEIEKLAPHADIRVATSRMIPGMEQSVPIDFDIVESDAQLDSVIQDFKPDILHTHFLEMLERLDAISARHGLPFTIRSHAYDVAAQRFLPKFEPWAQIVNGDRCKRILVFPYARERFETAGWSPEKMSDTVPVFWFDRFYDPTPRPPTHKIIALGSAWPKKNFEALIDAAANFGDYTVDLYAAGGQLDKLKSYNLAQGAKINIMDPVDFSEMPQVYRNYDWYIYTGTNDECGLPVSILEAQAAGLGILHQFVRGDTVDFVGKAGFVFRTMDEVAGIIAEPYPAEMRQAGFEQARAMNFDNHLDQILSVWRDSLSVE